MTDMATLGTRFVTEGADQTNAKLDQYQQKADGAQKASDGLAGGSKRASDALMKLLQSMEAQLKIIAQAQQGQQGYAKATNEAAEAVERQVEAAKKASTANISFSSSFKPAQSGMLDAAEAATKLTDDAKGSTKGLADLGKEAVELARDLGDGGGGGARGAAGAMRLAGNAAKTLGVGLGAAAMAILAASAAAIAYDRNMGRLQSTSEGVGRTAGLTGQQMEEAAKQGASAAGISVSAARNMAVELASTGKIGGEVFSGLIGLQRDFAAATNQDAKAATAELARAFADPARGAEDLNDKLHFLNATTLEHIQTLADQGQRTQAQILLEQELQNALGGTANSLGMTEGAWNGMAVGIKNAVDWMITAIGEMNQIITLGPQMRNALREKAEADAQARQSLAVVNSASTAAGAIANRYDPDRARLQGLINDRARVGQGIVAERALGNAAQVQVLAKAYGELDRAVTTYIPTGQKAQQLAELDAKAALARTAAEKGSIAAQRARIEAAGEVMSAEEVARKAASAATVASARQQATDDRRAESAARAAANRAASAARAAQRHAEQLARDLESMRATTAANYDLAEAYGVSDIAALKAAARADAVAKAVKSQGDVEAFVAARMELNASKIAASSAERLADLKFTTEAMTKLNEQVASGAITDEEANRQLAEQRSLRELTALATETQGEKGEFLRKVLADLKNETADLAQKERERALINSGKEAADQLEMLNLELSLIGQTNAARAVAIAQLQAKQKLENMGVKEGDSGYDKAIEDAGKLAALNEDLRTIQDNYNHSLDRTLDLLGAIHGIAQDTATALADSWGKAGQSIGNVLTTLTSYAERQERLTREHDEQVKAATLSQEIWASKDAKYDRDKILSLQRLADIEVMTAEQRKAAELAYTTDVLGATKQLFSEKSTAYKLLDAAEKASVALEAANTVRVIASSAARGAAKAAEGAATIFAALGPFGFPVVAAMVAVLAGLGLKGLGSGGRSASLPTSEDRQKLQGAGSVLGDSSAKSESLSRSLEIAASNTNQMLEYENEQLKSLRNIEAGIGAVAAGLARELRVGGAFDTSGLGLGKSREGADGLTKLFLPVISSLLPGLFGSTTTRTLNDQGLEFVAQTVGGIIADGVVGSTYQEIIEQTKKKLFGLTISNKSSVETVTGSLSGELSAQIAGIIGSLRGGVLAAASILGVEGAAATLDAFTVDLGKLSFADMTGAEIEDELNAIFGKLGDDMASAALPFLAELQKVGEGAFETLQRVARQYTVLDTSLESVGLSFGAVGVSSLAARERLIGLSGGIDDLASQIDFYAKAFLTDAERIAPVQRAVNAELERLGLVGLTTRDQFKAVVNGLDLTTEAGAEMFAAMMKLAPAFNEVIKYTESLALDLTDLATASADFQAGLLEASGITAQPTWQEEVTANRNARLASERSAAQAASEATAQTAEELAQLAQEAEDARIALVRTGDALAAVTQQQLALGDGFQDLGNGIAYAARLVAIEAAGDALNIQNAGKFFADLAKLSLNQTYIDQLTRYNQRQLTNTLGSDLLGRDISGNGGNTLGDALQMVARGFAISTATADRSLIGPGLAGVMGARQRLDFASEQDPFGRERFGADVIGYMDTLDRLKGALGATDAQWRLFDMTSEHLTDRFKDGKIGAEEFDTQLKALEDRFLNVGGAINYDEFQKALDAIEQIAPGLGAFAQDTEAQLQRIADAQVELGRAGAESLSMYFEQITGSVGLVGEASEGLADIAASTSEEVQNLQASIGRLTSVGDVMEESVKAILDGGALQSGLANFGDVDTALTIAEAARIAASSITTQAGSEIAAAIADNPAFAGMAEQDLRDRALLLDGLTAFDPASFEAAFNRLNAALISGALNQTEYQALFQEALDGVNGLGDAAKGAAGQLESLADKLLVSDLSPFNPTMLFGEALRQYRDVMSRVFGGDASAFGDREGAARTALQAAIEEYSTGADYDRFFASIVREQRLAEGGGEIRDYSLETANNTADIVSEIQGLRAEIAELKKPMERTANATEGTKRTQDYQARTPEDA